MLARSDITVCVPSSRRTREALHVKRFLLPQALVYVSENEFDHYVAAGLPLDCLRTHPNLLGLARIRNFIVRECPTQVCVMIDDDFRHVMCMPGRKIRIVKDAEMIDELVYSTSLVAAGAGSRLFAWGNKAFPVYYKDHEPFGLKDPVGRALGVIGKDVKWDERLMCAVDTDATLQELMESRIVLSDRRFYFDCGQIGGNPGGLQALRTTERMELDWALLKKKWGSFIRIEDGSRSGKTVNSITVDRRQGWSTSLESDR